MTWDRRPQEKTGTQSTPGTELAVRCPQRQTDPRGGCPLSHPITECHPLWGPKAKGARVMAISLRHSGRLRPRGRTLL